MKKQLKLLSLAAALCGAVACSSGGGSTTTTGGGPGTTGSSSGGATGSGPTGTASGGSPTGTASGGSPTGTTGGVTGTGGGSSTGSSSGGSSTGAPSPTTYPCVDGGPAYQPTNPPNNLPSCWCNPGDAGALSYYQIINSCPPPGSTPDLSIPLPPPVGTENIAGLAAANLPLFIDAGIPGE